MAQLLFVAYLVLGYGYATVTGVPANWNTFNDGSFDAADPIGNVAYGLHVLLAVVMLLGGPMQLIPAI
ncbi:hypothetical protein [Alteromonas oceanisediminis]|uniref:hypothetical protein n=1 Tax=Alteromonas oceanisediminis TaxID=2836180 RepID=UPI001BD9CA96|nr:hypothetical protein [Alteromonas oceanisediminis]MBT0587332.1 hypothetical protein [Alteromonas oceanisediminis]